MLEIIIIIVIIVCYENMTVHYTRKINIKMIRGYICVNIEIILHWTSKPE